MTKRYPADNATGHASIPMSISGMRIHFLPRYCETPCPHIHEKVFSSPVLISDGQPSETDSQGRRKNGSMNERRKKKKLQLRKQNDFW